MKIRALLLLLFAFGSCFYSIRAGAEQKPNVIVIYSDDQGSLDLNCYGSSDLHTPHLDRLAAKGVRFTQMYSPSAICSASRAGLMTGRFPARAGVPGNVSSAQGVPGMPSSEVTLAELMSSHGYATAHIGKWHLGYSPETMPNAQGFDYSFGHMGGCIDNYSHFFYWNGPNRHDLWRNGKEIFEDGEFFLDLMVQEARQFIHSSSNKPFFMYWAINAPHYPMQGTSKWRKRYKDLESPRRQYAEFVSTVDEKVGEVVSVLEELSLEKNTLIIFQSDHGHSTEERAFGGGGNAGLFRGAKGCLFEGGIRVPAIIKWSGKIKPNTVSETPIISMDFHASILDATGIEPDPTNHPDGNSLIDMCFGKSPLNRDAIYFHYPNYAFHKKNRPGSAIRAGDFKLIKFYDDNSVELYNLSEDLSEANDLAKSMPKKTAELKNKLESWISETNARVPTIAN